MTLDAGNTGATYLWSDASTNQTLSISTAGTYSVTVTDANSCSTYEAITITENTLPVIDLGTITAYCIGSSLTLDAGNAGATYLWSDASTNQTLNVSTAGTYSVTVTDANSCSANDAITITESALPVVDLGTVTTYCAGSSMTLDAGNAGATYLWNDGSTNQTLNVSTPGTYSVTVTNASNCSAYEAIIITENVAPVVNLGADDAYCIGTTYSATLDAGNVGATYLWSDNSTNQTLSISTAGTYSVTVTDANNCITKDTITITENTLPIVNLGVDTIYCAGSSMTLDAGNVGSNYLWNDNSINQTLSVSTAGTYSVTVTDANGCESADTIVLSTGAILTAGNLTSSASSNCGFDFGIAGVSNVDSYTWNFGDGSTETTTTAFASHTFVNEGDYTVTVTLSNECGTETKQINITCDKTGVNDVASDKRLTLYPNPTSTNITIENSGNLNMEVITIIDNLGKVVYHATPMITLDYQINVSHLSNGLYTVLVKTDKGVITKKIEVLK